jgi:hypothetical protein
LAKGRILPPKAEVGDSNPCAPFFQSLNATVTGALNPLRWSERQRGREATDDRDDLAFQSERPRYSFATVTLVLTELAMKQFS